MAVNSEGVNVVMPPEGMNIRYIDFFKIRFMVQVSDWRRGKGVELRMNIRGGEIGSELT